MRVRNTLACAVGSLVVFGFLVTAVASADTTLGLTTLPSGAAASSCTGLPPHPTLVESTQDPSTPYFVPGTGMITQWQTNITGDVPGAAITFAVVTPVSGNYTVVAADSETIPNPLPPGGVATFPLATPIPVQAGDTFALYAATAGVNCWFFGGSTPGGDNIVSVVDSSPPPSAGQTLTSPVSCGAGCALDVAANFSQSEDAAVTTSAGPANATAGSQALLSSTVTNNGPNAGPITFTDTVPSGLTIGAAAAGQGTCQTSGQKVTCTISGLGTGQSAPVDIVATAPAAGSYVNSVSVAVASPYTDPNSANSTATATLSVAAPPTSPSPPPPNCVIPNLKGLTLPLAKQLVHLLGCTAGPVRHAHSKSVHKGLLTGTSPGQGTYAAGTKIAFVVSSGPPRKHHHHHKHHK